MNTLFLQESTLANTVLRMQHKTRSVKGVRFALAGLVLLAGCARACADGAPVPPDAAETAPLGVWLARPPLPISPLGSPGSLLFP